MDKRQNPRKTNICTSEGRIRRHNKGSDYNFKNSVRTRFGYDNTFQSFSKMTPFEEAEEKKKEQNKEAEQIQVKRSRHQ